MIDDWYLAAMGDISWEVPLHQLRTQTQTRFAGMVSLDLESNIPTPLAAAADDAGWLQALLGSYQGEFGEHDPVAAVGRDWPEGRWLDEERDLSRAVREKGIYYQDFLQPFRIGAMSGFVVSRDAGTSTFLSLMASARHDGNQQRKDIERLRPHMARAVRLHARLGRLQRQAVLAESALDALAAPVLLLDESGALLLANAAAHRLIASEPALRFVGNRFQVAATAKPSSWPKACEQGGILLRDRHGQPMHFWLTPVPAPARLAMHWQRPLTLMMGRGGSQGSRTLLLRSLYGLTPAEAELCAMLALEGQSPQACADARKVAISTVRSQIRSIGEKLGTTRLTQIVQLTVRICGQS